jgi:2-hydroxychromene-2-carboxylate isomerase
VVSTDALRVSFGSVPRITFYFDLGSPYGYLAAERIGTLLPEPVEWQPVLLGGLFKLTGRSSWGLGERPLREAGLTEIERRARSYGLPAIRWPDPWPADYLFAMRAATFAFAADRGREFALEAYRSAFERGANLSDAASVLEAGRRAGLDPDALEAGAQDPGVKGALREATERAFELGVIGVPTIAIDDQPFWGDDRLEDAAAHLRAML